MRQHAHIRASDHKSILHSGSRSAASRGGESSMKRLCAISIALLMSAWAVEPVAAQQTFSAPRYGDNRLDWCLRWSTNCGKPAADAFCLRHRYAEASSFAIARGVSPTRLIGTRQICTGSFCDSFASITCVRPIRTGVFANPNLDGHRVDACWTWIDEPAPLVGYRKVGRPPCGRRAADEFCRRKGFRGGSRQFEMDWEPYIYGTTIFLGRPAVCRGHRDSCYGFQQIICRL
jgi:hypothetical protein